MLEDLKTIATPTNLGLLASIDFPTNNPIAQVASWFTPCRWVLGKEVLVFSKDDKKFSVKSSLPSRYMFEKSWVQTTFRIIFFIPNLLGHILQMWAVNRYEEFKQSYYDARKALIFHHLLNSNLTNPNVRKFAKNEIEVLLPGRESKYIFGEHVLDECMKDQEKVNQVAGFAFEFLPDGFCQNYWKALWNDEGNSTFKKIAKIVSSIANDSENGADNLEKFLSDAKLGVPTNCTESDLRNFKKLLNELISIGLNQLIDSQKKKFKTNIVERKTFENHSPVSAQILFKLKSYFELVPTNHTAPHFNPVIILFGPPGSGKGTFSQYLKEKYKYNHVSAGDVVRQEIDLQTSLGLEIQNIIKRGDYIDAKEMDVIIEKKVAELVNKGGPLILDGFVHSERDLEDLCKLIDTLKLRSRVFILYLNADESLCKERISNRLVCIKCYHVYNTALALPRIDGKCDVCFSNLKQRINDAQGVIEKRIGEYRLSSATSFPKAKNIFPHVTFETNRSKEACLKFYDLLAMRVASFKGKNTQEFIEQITIEASNL